MQTCMDSETTWAASTSTASAVRAEHRLCARHNFVCGRLRSSRCDPVSLSQDGETAGERSVRNFDGLAKGRT